MRLGPRLQLCADEFDQNMGLFLQAVNLLRQRPIAGIFTQKPFQVLYLTLMAYPHVAPPSYLGRCFHADPLKMFF
jgi:hypothetical protein